MKRQGLITTIGELRRIADDLEKELKETFRQANCGYPENAATNQIMHQLNIINEEGLSDTWEFEDNNSQQGLNKEVGSKRILSSNKSSTNVDNPSDTNSQESSSVEKLVEGYGHSLIPSQTIETTNEVSVDNPRTTHPDTYI